MSTAFIGIAYSNDVIYNVMVDKGSFDDIGKNIIDFLYYDKNRYIASIIESQSFESITEVSDDFVFYGGEFDPSKTNVMPYNRVTNLMNSVVITDYYYIFDVINDVLIVKTPSMIRGMALDYTNEEDVEYFRDYINNI